MGRQRGSISLRVHYDNCVARLEAKIQIDKRGCNDWWPDKEL